MCAVVGVYPCSRTDTNGQKTVPKTATACLYLLDCLILRFVCLSVCPSVRLFALLLACDAYTEEPIQTRSGLIDARYLCLKSRTARVESGAEIAAPGHSDCFLPVAIVTGVLYSNLRVLSQAPSPDLHLQQNKQPASTTSSQPPPPPPPPQPPSPPPPPPPTTKSRRSLYCSWRLVFVVV